MHLARIEPDALMEFEAHVWYADTQTMSDEVHCPPHSVAGYEQ
jgi:hypothetical protein